MSADVSLQSPGRSGRSSDPNRALHTVAVTIASSRGSAALPSLVARRTAALARVDACAIYVTRPEGGVRSIARYVRAGAAEPTALRRLDRRGVYSAEDVRHCRRVMDTGQPAVLEAAEARDELVQGWARALTRGRPGHPTTFGHPSSWCRRWWRARPGCREARGGTTIRLPTGTAWSSRQWTTGPRIAGSSGRR